MGVSQFSYLRYLRLAGAVYILNPDRVHSLNVPFSQAVRVITQWGSGSKDLVAAIDWSKSKSHFTR